MPVETRPQDEPPAISKGKATAAEALLNDLPKLHRWGGKDQVGGLDRQIAQRMMAEVGRYDAPRIVETGAGASTLLFCCLEPAALTTIAPDSALKQRMTAAAEERGISLDRLRFICDYSELALPKLVEAGEQYDVAFIDGCHNWPAVFVDFCYAYMLLPKGGTLLLDDLQLYSVAQLYAFLRRQEQFEYVALDSKMATFRKVVDGRFLPEWRSQPFIAGNTIVAPDQA